MKAQYLRLFLLVVAVGFSGALSCGDNGQTNEATPEASPTESIGTPEPATATPEQPGATPASTPPKERTQVVTSHADAPGCRDYVHIPRPLGPFRIGSCSLPSPDKLDASSLKYEAYEDYVSYEAMAAAADDIGTFYAEEMPKHGWALASSSTSRARCEPDGHCASAYWLDFVPEGAKLVPLEGVKISVTSWSSEYGESLEVELEAAHPSLQKPDMTMFVQGD